MGDSDAGESAQTLDRGLAGVEQASRAATLLALMIDPSAAPPPSSAAGAYAQDVLDILRAHARRIGVSVESKLDISSLSAGNIAPASTADALVAGLATLERSRQATRDVRTTE